MSYLLTFFAGVGTGIIGVILYAAYNYYKAWKQAYDEGWDMPN